MQVKKEYKFYAGHRNQELQDKCMRPHGHDYKVFCYFDVVRTGSISTLFSDFDKFIEPYLKEHFDHRFMISKDDPLLKYLIAYEEDHKISLGLNIMERVSSVENVCFALFSIIIERFVLPLRKIEIQETRTSTLIYTKNDYLIDFDQFNTAK